VSFRAVFLRVFGVFGIFEVLLGFCGDFERSVDGLGV
jgi:hypothetical protein